jgi:hypothetical protein
MSAAYGVTYEGGMVTLLRYVFSVLPPPGGMVTLLRDHVAAAG